LWFLARIVFKPPKLLQELIGRLLGTTAALIGFFLGLWTLGANPTTLLAGVGVASLVIGFALQDTLGNLAAGFFILLHRPYDVDDVVAAGGVMGRVKTMGLANTTIVTFDNRRLFVPNRKIWGDVIENRSAEATRRIDTAIRVGYREDVDEAIGILRRLLERHELVLDEPAPAVFVSELAESWIEIEVRPWTKSENWWTLKMQLSKLLRLELEKHGIEAPSPRRIVRLSQANEKGEV
jgi:small conductance mechanosensitive channel